MAKLYKLKNGIYYIYYRQADNSENRVSTRTRIKYEAQKIYEEFVTSRNVIQKPVVKEEIKPVESITLEKYKERFLEYSKAFHSIKTYNDYETTFNILFKTIHPSTLLSKVTLRDINSIIQKRMAKSVHAARRDVINIKAMFNKAVSEGYLVSNPCSLLKRIKIPEKQPLFLSKENFTKLLSVVDEPDFYDVIVFAVFTGLRQAEIIEMNWSQVDLTNKIVTLDNHTHITKSRKVRTIPLNQTLLELLERKKKKVVSEYVFPYRGNIIKADILQDRFRKYITKAELNPKLHFHSLRHTFASWLVQGGISIYHVSKLLGHADIKTTEIYAHLVHKDLSMAVESLNQMF